MGQAITSLGSNNLLGMFGVNDALMHMFPDTHKNIADRLTLKNIIFPGGFGRRKRSANLNLSKPWSSNEYLGKEDTNMGPIDWSSEGIDNKAFEEELSGISKDMNQCYEEFSSCMERSAIDTANTVFVGDEASQEYRGKYKTTAQMRSYHISLKDKNQICKSTFEECLQSSIIATEENI